MKMRIAANRLGKLVGAAIALSVVSGVVLISCAPEEKVPAAVDSSAQKEIAAGIASLNDELAPWSVEFKQVSFEEMVFSDPEDEKNTRSALENLEHHAWLHLNEVGLYSFLSSENLPAANYELMAEVSRKCKNTYMSRTEETWVCSDLTIRVDYKGLRVAEVYLNKSGVLKTPFMIQLVDDTRARNEILLSKAEWKILKEQALVSVARFQKKTDKLLTIRVRRGSFGVRPLKHDDSKNILWMIPASYFADEDSKRTIGYNLREDILSKHLTAITE
jgi:hypothetical protein